MNDTDLNVWATSRSGKVKIRMYALPDHLVSVYHGYYQVYALDGHETMPYTRSFDTLHEARGYANSLWATL